MPLQKQVENGLEISIKNTKQIGLSNSRNMLLKYATGDICALCDDDITYRNGYKEKIFEAYSDYPNADIIVFCYSQEVDTDTRRPFSKPKKLNLFTISKVASVEITFKLESIRRANLLFDTLLGLGAKFYSGEENAFLADALRAGLKIQYVPWTICYSRFEERTVKWENGYDETYFLFKGASYYRTYKQVYMLFAVAFILLKKRNIFKDVPLFSAIKWMSSGKKAYKQAQKELKNVD